MKNEAEILFDVPFEIRRYVFEIHDFNSMSKLPWNVSSACRQWMAWKRSCMSWGSSAVTWLSNVHRCLWLELSLCVLRWISLTWFLMLSAFSTLYTDSYPKSHGNHNIIMLITLADQRNLRIFYHQLHPNNNRYAEGWRAGEEVANFFPERWNPEKPGRQQWSTSPTLLQTCAASECVPRAQQTSLVSPEQDDDVPWLKQKYKHVKMFKFKFTRYVGQDDCDGLQCCRCTYVRVC